MTHVPRFLLLPALLFAACTAPRTEAPARNGCHPACPAAVSGGIATSTTLGDARALAHASAEVPAGAMSSLAYVCPMHLTIGADTPGRCPVCHMKLVPRAELEPEHRDER